MVLTKSYQKFEEAIEGYSLTPQKIKLWTACVDTTPLALCQETIYFQHM